MRDSTRSPIFPVLETQRLLLRELQQGDIRPLFALLSDIEVVRFYDTPFTRIEQVERSIERHHFRFLRSEGLRWGIKLKEKREVIGNCGYAWDKSNHCATLSYMLGVPYWGQGIMTEALGAVIRYGFEQCQLHRIEADVAVPNVGSMRVLQKLGFHEEGLRKERFLSDGQYYDEKLFALLRDE